MVLLVNADRESHFKNLCRCCRYDGPYSISIVTVKGSSKLTIYVGVLLSVIHLGLSIQQISHPIVSTFMSQSPIC